MNANTSRVLLFLLLSFQIHTFAQMGINSTGTPPATNAMLDISSTSKGLLIPRMTTIQRIALAHAQGLTVFDITTNGYWYSDGAAWRNLITDSTVGQWLTSGGHIYNGNTLGYVGIGTIPNIHFHVGGQRSVLFGSNIYGSGTKLTWLAGAGAFRAGHADVDEFDAVNIGDYSIGLGYNTIARGNHSLATGANTSAIGVNSTAMGNITTASGNNSTAMGNNTTASGMNSTAIGVSSSATGTNSMAMGFNSTASVDKSFALGNNANASGLSSMSIGYYAQATGNYSTSIGEANTASGLSSTAMGYHTDASGETSTSMGAYSNTNSHKYAFCIAGAAGNISTLNTTDYQMMMRFDNYTFMLGSTGNYVYLLPASNGWTYVSDRNRKENFEELNGESVLKKIANIPFYSWNFKDKEIKQYRHYGIMAQDFHDNFGKDNLGVIGNDTTVSALDLLGVAYSGIKALEKRTEALIIKNEKMEIQLQIQNQKFKEEIAELKAMITPKRKKYVAQKIQLTKKVELFTLK
jgi:hypothetical protein